MGVMRGSRPGAHRSRHNIPALYSSGQEAGKGLYIGGDDAPPTLHQHHHHHTSTTAAALRKAVPNSKQWDNPDIDLTGNSNNYNVNDKKESFPTNEDYTQSGGALSNPLADTPLPSSSPLPYLYSNSQTRSGGSPYMESEGSPFGHSRYGHIRHNMTFHDPAHSSIHRDNPSATLSSHYSRLYSDTHILNLGVEHASTVSPLQGAPIIDPIDPLPTADWNFTDTLCQNKTPGNFDCWDLFNPDENDTTTQNPFLIDDEYRYWTLVLMLIPLLTVFGNVLVVMSVIKEKTLKTVTNYFICSLAVADIMVAVVVMSFAVFMEVVNNRWMLSDGLCDAWVASDVLGCTASILNLTAICVDRFIAVTQPIKYAKHKNSKRVFIMLAITWVISVAIAAPIALGVNYSDDRKAGDCQFFNSDFIIYSSMGSFYIPSVIMCFLYWKIYRVIRQRARKARKAKQLRDVDKKALQGVIENPAAAATQNTNDTGGVYGAEATVTTGLAKMDNGRVTYNTTKATTSRLLAAEHGDANSVTNINSNSDDNSNDDDEDESPSGSGSANNNTTSRDHKKAIVVNVVTPVNPKLLRNAEAAELISNPVAEELERLENEEQQAMLQFGKNGGCARGLQGPASTSRGAGQTLANEAETPFTSLVCKGDNSDNSEDKDGSSPKKKESDSKRGQKKGVTKFNFHMRTSRKRKEKSSSRREKKATKTLAIVLGVFLACWVPFFTLNIIKAICIRYKLSDYPACQVDPILFSLFQWLGYINSFLNPVIYTIFNQEFRKAFRRLLTEPCS